MKPHYKTAHLHQYQTNITEDRLNDDKSRRIRTLDHVVEVETIDAVQEEKTIKELKQNRSWPRKCLIFYGTMTLGGQGVILFGPAAYTLYAWAGMGISEYCSQQKNALLTT